MTGKTLQIQVQDDHLARIAQTRKPILALAELIWNALDADATRVDVTLLDNDLNGLMAINVADNGHGIPYAEADELFSRTGGSWKRSRLILSRRSAFFTARKAGVDSVPSPLVASSIGTSAPLTPRASFSATRSQ